MSFRNVTTINHLGGRGAKRKKISFGSSPKKNLSKGPPEEKIISSVNFAKKKNK